MHEVLEREKDEQVAARVCRHELSATKQQLELQRQKCDVELAKAELEMKRELQREADKCRAAATGEQRGKR